MEDSITILTSLVNTIKSSVLTKEDRISFDNVIKTNLSSLPLDTLLRGPTLAHKLCATEKALQELSEDELKSTEYRLQIWNPTIAASFKALAKVFNLLITTKSLNIKNGKEQAQEQPTAPQREKKQQERKQLVATSDPGQKAQRTCPDSAYKKIQEMINTSEDSPYSKDKHVNCKKNKCPFCRSLAYQLPMTRCIGHKCNKFGWFPHITSNMWRSIKSSHDKPTADNWRGRKDFTYKEHQSKSLRDYYNQPPTASTSLPTDDSMDADSQRTLSTIKSVSSWRTSGTSSRKRQALSWADEIDGVSQETTPIVEDCVHNQQCPHAEYNKVGDFIGYATG